MSYRSAPPVYGLGAGFSVSTSLNIGGKSSGGQTVQSNTPQAFVETGICYEHGGNKALVQRADGKWERTCNNGRRFLLNPSGGLLSMIIGHSSPAGSSGRPASILVAPTVPAATPIIKFNITGTKTSTVAVATPSQEALAPTVAVPVDDGLPWGWILAGVAVVGGGAYWAMSKR